MPTLTSFMIERNPSSKVTLPSFRGKLEVYTGHALTVIYEILSDACLVFTER